MIAEVTVRGAARALLPARKRHVEERRKPWSEHEADSVYLPGSEGEHILQDQLGTSPRAQQFYKNQVVDYLTPVMAEFVGRMEMAFIATSDPSGECDCSFRAGAPGFIRVIDDKTIAYPELRGNGVMASMGNMLQNPHIAIFLVDFSRDLIGLHVNGDASIVPPAHMLEFNIEIDEAENAGKRPVQWVLIHVTEAYIHCSKHIPLLVPQSRIRHWGTDSPRHKGGDYFGVTALKTETGLIEPRRRAAPAAVNGSAQVPAANGSAPHPAVNGSASIPAVNGSASHAAVNGSASHPAVNGSASHPAVNGSAFLSAPTPHDSAPPSKADGPADAQVDESATHPAAGGADPRPADKSLATLPQANRSGLRPQCQGSASLRQSSRSSSPPSANGSAVPL